MSFNLLGVLGPEIKILLVGFAIAGPMAVIGLIIFIKKIEKENPERVRW